MSIFGFPDLYGSSGIAELLVGQGQVRRLTVGSPTYEAPRTNSLEGGTNGVTVSTANSGGASGTAFDFRTLGGGFLTYDDTVTPLTGHGVNTIKFDPFTNTSQYVSWTLGNTTIVHSAIYARFSGVPNNGITSLLEVRTSDLAAAVVATTTKLEVYDNNGVVYSNAAANISAGVWYRIELRVVVGKTVTDGAISFAMYLGDGTTPVASYSSTSVDTTIVETGMTVRIGRNNATYGSTDETYTSMDSLSVWRDNNVPLTMSNPWAIEVPSLSFAPIMDGYSRRMQHFLVR